MSIESAQAFIVRMKSDTEFAKKVTGCKDAESRKAFVRGEGFDFSADDISEFKAQVEDSELALVSGGLGCDDIAWQCGDPHTTFCI